MIDVRLIDADALIEQLEGILSDYTSHGAFPNGYDIEDAMDSITNAPTIDAIPVVRCKDCKFWEHGDCYRLELSRLTDFCSYGERKE